MSNSKVLYHTVKVVWLDETVFRHILLVVLTLHTHREEKWEVNAPKADQKELTCIA